MVAVTTNATVGAPTYEPAPDATKRHTQQVNHRAPRMLVLRQEVGMVASDRAAWHLGAGLASAAKGWRQAAAAAAAHDMVAPAGGGPQGYLIQRLLRCLAHGGVRRLAGAQRRNQLVGLHSCKPSAAPANLKWAADAPMAALQCTPTPICLLRRRPAGICWRAAGPRPHPPFLHCGRFSYRETEQCTGSLRSEGKPQFQVRAAVPRLKWARAPAAVGSVGVRRLAAAGCRAGPAASRGQGAMPRE